MLNIDRLVIGGLPPLSFQVRAGECLAIEGPSGCGKTRLLRAIADLDPAEGYVFLEGVERREMKATKWRRRVRYCAAEPGWWSDRPRDHFRLAGSSEAQIDRLLSSVGLTPAQMDRPISAFSTGERQRLSLARSLLNEPRVLLLDEPTASLDSNFAALVEELIRFQILSNRIVLLVSHREGQIARLADGRLMLGRTPKPPELGAASSPRIKVGLAI